VDDYPTNLNKISAAVVALGHRATEARSGTVALQMLSEGGIDLVLLDIVMPTMDGFAVLDNIKSNMELHDIPVIVISSLDDDMTSVVKAIELGAEDFLPKYFGRSLFKARIEACLEKKRLRDIEMKYLDDVRKLTRAAQILEQGIFNPSKLGITQVSQRADALGVLAEVFSAMALEVYERERVLFQRVHTARGTLLLIACGVLWALNVPLSKLATNISPHPFGLTLALNVVAALFCTAITLLRSKMPGPQILSWNHFRYLAIAALLAGVVNQTLVYWTASMLPASMVSIVIVLEGFAVFVLSAILKVEKATFKRLTGLLIGLTGVFVVIWLGEAGSEPASSLRLFIAFFLQTDF
jgi:CheY-like chemotaxis protein